MLAYILYGLFIAACLILVAAVLLQPGKTDASALFTSNISSTAFGPRGTQTVLAKITIGAAAAFMIMAFLLSQPALTGNRSVLETTAAPIESPESQAATPMASPVEQTIDNANSKTNIVTETNTPGNAANSASSVNANQ